jgi:hypothetical protein
VTPVHEPRKEFFWTGPGPDGRGSKSKFYLFFHIKIGFYWYLRRIIESDDDLDRKKNWVRYCTLLRGGN